MPFSMFNVNVTCYVGLAFDFFMDDFEKMSFKELQMMNCLKGDFILFYVRKNLGEFPI